MQRELLALKAKIPSTNEEVNSHADAVREAEAELTAARKVASKAKKKSEKARGRKTRKDLGEQVAQVGESILSAPPEEEESFVGEEHDEPCNVAWGWWVPEFVADALAEMPDAPEGPRDFDRVFGCSICGSVTLGEQQCTTWNPLLPQVQFPICLDCHEERWLREIEDMEDLEPASKQVLADGLMAAILAKVAWISSRSR